MDTGDPIAFFLTWVTYGTWLPGDARGWVEYKQGWQLPSPTLEADCNARMIDRAVRLSLDQRMAVERQIQDTCCHGGWHLYAGNCRTNHVHTVVTAPERRGNPKRKRGTLFRFPGFRVELLPPTARNTDRLRPNERSQLKPSRVVFPHSHAAAAGETHWPSLSIGIRRHKKSSPFFSTALPTIVPSSDMSIG